MPGIKFDAHGVSNYAHLHETLLKEYPRGDKGEAYFKQQVATIKANRKQGCPDCIVGISGGTDSSYLLYLLKEQYGLNPLAVNLDNGWSSHIALENIKKVTTALSVELETYVVDYEEIKDLLRSYMMASLPWIDLPTDIAIKAILYRVAAKEKVKYIFRGNDFRSEGTQPFEWTNGDGRQLRYLHKQFGRVPLKTFPNQNLSDLVYYGFIRQIKSIYPFYYHPYNKQAAMALLKEKFGWVYYGGHHHENLFTKFAIAYWLPEKFGIDKRIITLSAQILSGQITREQGIQELTKPAYDATTFEYEMEFVLKKLDLSKKEFDQIMKLPNRSFYDYPSYFGLISKYQQLADSVLKLIYPYRTMTSYQLEMRRQ